MYVMKLLPVSVHGTRNEYLREIRPTFEPQIQTKYRSIALRNTSCFIIDERVGPKMQSEVE